MPRRRLTEAAGLLLTRHNRARLILAILALFLVWGVWRPLPRHGATIAVERTDSAHSAAVIARVARGEPYYAALDGELRARGYPTGSVFNWRLPTLTVALARAPLLMWVLLGLLAVAVIAGTMALFFRSAPEIMLLALLMQIGASAGAFNPLAFVLPECWAGVLIALSVLLYARGRFQAAAAAGIAALFVRELSAPYVAMCGALALRDRRHGEVAVWAVGGLAWCVFYYLHATAAAQFIQPADLAHPSWVQFGGFRFILATIGFGGWLYLLPPWVAAVGGVLLLSSGWAPIRAPHIKTTTYAYLAFFFAVGQPFNQSWGILTAPVWAIGYGLGGLGVMRLVGEAKGR